MLIRTTFISLCLAGSGCASVLGFVAGANLHDAEPQKAANPLAGEQIMYRVTSRDSILQNVSHPECTTWPIHDEYVVRATPGEICVDSAVKYSVAPAYGGQRRAPTWALVGDGDATTQLKLRDVHESRQIGTCTHGSTTYQVWEQDVTGCAPNAGTLTDKSTKLAIRVATPAVKYNIAAWTFQ
jgi:hypothetical protein